MKLFEYSGTNRPRSHWGKLAAVSLIAAAALAGCGGGSDGAAGAAGANGTNGTNGTNGKDLVNVVTVASNAAPATTASAAAFKALAPQVTVTSVVVNGPPVVTFKVTDASGNPVVGLGNYTQTSTATVHSLANISFTLAKLVPATTATVTSGTSTKVISTEPSKWVSYGMLKPVTVAQAAGTITADASCNQVAATATAAAVPATWCGTYPAPDTQGTLVDNGDGTYQYTFYRDPSKVAAIAATLNDSVDGLSKKADMGDLTYNANLTHRLGIFISGNAPGTSTNTPNGVAFAATATAVPMVKTFNIGYDFIPATGKPVVVGTDATRDVVQKSSCSGCHDGKGIGHASTTSSPGDSVGRNDPRLCVTCHTDQIKYSFYLAGGAPLSADGMTLIGGVTGTTAQKRAEQAVLYGRSVGNYPSLIHKTHMGDELVLQGYNFNANGGAQMFNTVGFPQSPANCTKCHDASPTKSDGTVNANQTTDGDNWKNVPSMLACGACHDGINFAAGTGVTLADRDKDAAAGVALGTTRSGHVGGAKTDNGTCAMCHDATTIPVYHRTTAATLNNPVPQAGISTISFGITSVTLNASKQPVVTFQVKKDGVAVTSFAVPTLVTNALGAQVVSPNYEPIAGFAGGPSVYLAYAVPQDGISKPADFNTYASVALANLLIPAGSPKQGTLTSDGAGNFTATLTGDLVGQPVTATCLQNTGSSAIVGNCVNPSPIVIPANATMVTGAIRGSFTQKNLAAYPYTPANVSVNPNVGASGGVAVAGDMVQKLATGITGNTARRVIVAAAKCNACHDKLGTSPNFHLSGASAGAGPSTDSALCAVCHNPNRTSTGWSADSSTYIHGIHGSSKRSNAFTWQAVSATDNYGGLGYPGVLKDCNQCHLPNTVNFGATGGTAVAPNLLWSTTAVGKYNAATDTKKQISPYVTADNVVNYGNGVPMGAAYIAAGAVVPAQTSSTGAVTAAHVAVAGGEYVAADAKTLVNSPIASACSSCHDTSSAKAHMVTNGGSIYEARGTALLKGEACLVCHGAGTEFDAAVVHQ